VHHSVAAVQQLTDPRVVADVPLDHLDVAGHAQRRQRLVNTGGRACHRPYPVPGVHQCLHGMRPDESAGAGDQYLHLAPPCQREGGCCDCPDTRPIPAGFLLDL